MKANIQIDSLIAKSGETTYRFLDAGEMQDGTTIKLLIAVTNGIEDGAIIAILIANVFAFHFCQAQSIAADSKKMNRCFLWKTKWHIILEYNVQ